MIYRESIQVLRGLAVIAVLGYHFNLPGFENGFLGVDVFFVISGYLMANIYNGGRFKDFYMRRIRRLLPAYLTTISLSYLAAYFLLIPSDFTQLVQQIKSALLASPNLYFWSQNSYFQSTDFNPLLNLWSLGVEFHFYLLVPFIFLLNKKVSQSNLFLFFGFLGACFFAVTLSPKSAFYLLPFRLWEFLFGFLVFRISFAKFESKRYKPLNFLLLVLLLLIFQLAPLDGFSQNFLSGHPGLFALLIVIITGLLIALNYNSLFGIKRLDTIFAQLGKYSFSLYLIHFPLLVLMNYKPFSGTILRIDGGFKLIVLICLTFVLAIMQYHFVEDVFRNSRSFKKFLLYFILVSIPVVGVMQQTQQSRYTKNEIAISNSHTDRPQYRCGKAFRAIHPFSNLCRLQGKDEGDNVLLFGNSHADAIKNVFLDSARNLNVGVYFWSENSPLSVSIEEFPQMAREISNQGINDVYFHFSPGGADLRKLSLLTDLLSNLGIKSHIFGPVPTWKEHVPKVLWESYQEGSPLPSQTYEDFMSNNVTEINFLRNGLAPGTSYYELAKALCSPTCRTSSLDFKPYYFDKDHLTNTGARQLASIFDLALRQRL